MNREPQHETGDFRLSPFEICGWNDFPYGIDIDCMSNSIEEDINKYIGVVRAALKKAKANL